MTERTIRAAGLSAALSLWLLAPASQAENAIAAALSDLRPAERPSGLVLGIRWGESYRTLYLTHRDGDVRLARDVPVIVSPQADGFWQLGTVTVTAPPGCPRKECPVSATQVWAGPDRPDLDALARDLGRQLQDDVAGVEGGSVQLLERIEYVANGTVCRSARLEAFTGGAHPGFLSENHCLRLAVLPEASPAEAAEPLAYAAPSERREAFDTARSELRAEVAAGRFEEMELAPDEVADGLLSPPDFDRPAFRLDRRDGVAHVALLIEAGAPYVLSRTYTLTAAADYGPADPPIAPYNPVPAFLPALGAAVPDLRDVFVSPAEDVVFLLTGDRLVAVAPTGAELWSMPLAWNQVVMAEWAVGDSTDRWTRMIGEETR